MDSGEDCMPWHGPGSADQALLFCSTAASRLSIHSLPTFASCHPLCHDIPRGCQRLGNHQAGLSQGSSA